jgi:hypothetical protein
VNHVVSGDYKNWVQKQYAWRSYSRDRTARLALN